MTMRVHIYIGISVDNTAKRGAYAAIITTDLSRYRYVFKAPSTIYTTTYRETVFAAMHAIASLRCDKGTEIILHARDLAGLNGDRNINDLASAKSRDSDLGRVIYDICRVRGYVMGPMKKHDTMDDPMMAKAARIARGTWERDIKPLVGKEGDDAAV